MAVDPTKGIPFTMDSPGMPNHFHIPFWDIDPTIPLMIARIGEKVAGAIPNPAKKLQTDKDNAIQFQFQIRGTLLDNLNSDSMDFDVFMESMGPGPEYDPAAIPALHAVKTDLYTTGTTIPDSVHHQEHSVFVDFAANTIPAGTYKTVVVLAHNSGVATDPPIISGFCELGYLRFVDVL
jgi:hypothetical protein